MKTRGIEKWRFKRELEEEKHGVSRVNFERRIKGSTYTISVSRKGGDDICWDTRFIQYNKESEKVYDLLILSYQFTEQSSVSIIVQASVVSMGLGIGIKED